ncbi:MAG: cobalamin biosynthesis protein CobQ [Clostridia bacterium]|nr:cobalamin biosynthesis protein CobQ [Clostridia bacterium]
MEELNIVWAYPDMLNLHGDRGNVMALERIAKQMDIKTNIKRIDSYEDKIDFNSADIIFFNPGELKVMPSIIEALEKQREELEEYINNEKIIVVIGTTGSIMAKETKRIDGSSINGLGILDMNCTERKMVYGDDIHFSLKEDSSQELIGCQIQMIDTELQSDISFGQVIYGMGNNNGKSEGARYKNVIFTNALRTCFS